MLKGSRESPLETTKISLRLSFQKWFNNPFNRSSPEASLSSVMWSFEHWFSWQIGIGIINIKNYSLQQLLNTQIVEDRYNFGGWAGSILSAMLRKYSSPQLKNLKISEWTFICFNNIFLLITITDYINLARPPTRQRFFCEVKNLDLLFLMLTAWIWLFLSRNRFHVLIISAK